jgi:hypothetical protein
MKLECLTFDAGAAINSPGSPTQKTGIPFSGTEKCLNEIEVRGPKNGTRFICAALLSGKNFFRHYEACQMKDSCPVGSYKPIEPLPALIEVRS